jgi:hypothetical protein
MNRWSEGEKDENGENNPKEREVDTNSENYLVRYRSVRATLPSRKEKKTKARGKRPIKDPDTEGEPSRTRGVCRKER